MPVRPLVICLGVLLGVPAIAQTTAPAPPAPAATPSAPVAPDAEDPRYSFNRVEDGYLRLDSRTGHVSLCGRRQVGWACQALPDDRVVLESEIARLQTENGLLKKEMLSRGIALPGGVKPPSSEPPQAERKPKSLDPDLDRAMTVVETLWRRLVEMIASLQRDLMKKS
jgi:hypothetical protein